MAERIEIIEGEIFSDHRGEIYSLNNFEFEDVKRAYIIHHPDKSVIRGWHAHKHERKWFYCIKGEWTLGLIKIDDWDSPSPSLIPTIINLTDKDSKLICVPAGYANCLKAKMMMRLSRSSQTFPCRRHMETPGGMIHHYGLIGQNFRDLIHENIGNRRKRFCREKFMRTIKQHKERESSQSPCQHS